MKIHIILATMLAGGAAMAQETVDFDMHDTDRDGYLTQEEWADIDYITVDFTTLDANSDGMLDRNEVNSGMQQPAQADPQLSSGSQSQDDSATSTAISTESGAQSASESSTEADMNPPVMSGEQASSSSRFDRANYEGEDGDARFREDFDRRDTNADGFLDETEATNEDWIDINLFEKSDVNDDGLIDIGEAEDGFMEFGDDENESLMEEDY